MVKLRLKRFGRRNRPFYRINAIDSRAARDGRSIEELGWYDPMARDDSKQFHIDTERAQYWLGTGAKPSRIVSDLLKKVGIDAKPE